MALANDLFAALDPFTRHPAFAKWLEGSGGVEWSIRPFWIINDLRLMHDWMNNGQIFSNRPIDRKKTPLIHHYMQYLKSAEEQSLILTRNKIVLGEFDLLPIDHDQYFNRELFRSPGYFISYLFPGIHASPVNLQTGLGYLRKMIVQAKPDKPVYIDIPIHDFLLPPLIVEAGFIFLKKYTVAGSEMNLFVSI
jgi:hypothetical protein